MPKTYQLHIDDTLSAEELVKRLVAALSVTAPSAPRAEAEQAPTSKPTAANSALTLEEVRARLAKARIANKDLDLAAVFQKFGGQKLSDLDPKHYPDLLATVEFI